MKDYDIKLAGGGKGASEPDISDNTLQTVQTAKILDLISYGPIGGLIDGAKSVFFDGTPLRNSDGSYNFQNVIMDSRTGTASQTYIQGFSAVESTTTDNNLVGQGSPVAKTMGADDDAVRVIVGGTALQQIQDDGDIRGIDLSFSIQTFVAGQTWETRKTINLNEKSSGPWSLAYRIEKDSRAGDGVAWQFRIVRNTANRASTQIEDRLYLQSHVAIQDVKLSYANNALVSLLIPSNSVDNRVPSRSYEIQGRIIAIPSNWTGSAYSGEWNGTFQYAVSDDPIWIVYDLLTDDDIGLGIPAAQIDAYSFYDASVYASQLVDGERRFAFNGTLTTQEQPSTTLNSILAIAQAKLILVGGLITVVQDRPGNAVKIFNESNVENGLFTYTSSSLENRITVANVTYQDPNDSFATNVATESASTADINRYGWNERSFNGLGITSEKQARRFAKYIIDTALRETDTVTFTVGLENYDVYPGEIVKVLDSNYAGADAQGRIISATTTSVTLDRPVSVGGALSLLSPDGDILQVTPTNSGTTDTVTFAAVAAGDVPAAGTPYIIENAVSARTFRIQTVTEVERHRFGVTATQYDPAKYARIEQGIVTAPPVYNLVRNFTVSAPSGITFTETAAQDNQGVSQRWLAVRWTTDVAERVTHWRVAYRIAYGEVVPLGQVEYPEVRIPAPTDGLYEVFITAVNFRGVRSTQATGSYTLSSGTSQASSLAQATNLRRKGTTYGVGDYNVFAEPYLTVVWDDPNSYAAVRGYEIEIRIASVKKATYFVNITDGREFTYTYERLVADLGTGVREFSLGVAVIDGYGRKVPSALFVTFGNNAPQTPSMVVSEGYDAVVGRILPNAIDTDIALYRVWASKTNPPPMVDGNLVHEGADEIFTFPATAGTWYMKCRAIDTFGLPTLSGTDSSVYTATTYTYDIPTTGEIQTQIDNSVPDDYRIRVFDTKFRVTNNVVSWTQGWVTVEDVKTGATSSYQITAGNHDRSAIASRVIYYYDVANSAANIQNTTDWTNAAGYTKIMLAQHTQNSSQVIQYELIPEIHADYIAARSIQAGHVAAGALTANEIAANTITGGKIAAGTITGDRIAANTIAANRIASGSLTSTQIAAGAITADELAVNAVTADKIAAGAVTADSVGANQIITSSANIADATITNAKISGQINSSNYDWPTKTGWAINPNGDAVFGDVGIYDNGSLVFGTGGFAANLDFSRVGGATKPANNATVGADWDSNLTSRPDERIYNYDDTAGLGINGTFSGPWTSNTVPTGWSDWAAGNLNTKNTVWVLTGTSSFQQDTPGNANRGLFKTVTFTSPLAANTPIEGNYKVRFGARQSGTGLPGVMIRLFTDAGLTTFVDRKISPPYRPGTWLTVPFSASHTAAVYGFNLYIMSSGNILAGGQYHGTVIWDSVRVSIKHPDMYMAEFDRNVTGQITSSNVSTYIANAAIQSAQIVDAAITNAKIGSLAVDTIKVANAAITKESNYTMNSFSKDLYDGNPNWYIHQDVTHATANNGVSSNVTVTYFMECAGTLVSTICRLQLRFTVYRWTGAWTLLDRYTGVILSKTSTGIAVYDTLPQFTVFVPNVPANSSLLIRVEYYRQASSQNQSYGTLSNQRLNIREMYK